MDSITGYIVGIENPGMSGLATLTIASRKNAVKTKRPGKIRRVYVEAGFGVRQIVGYFGSWQAVKDQAPVTKLRFALDGALVQEIGPAEVN